MIEPIRGKVAIKQLDPEEMTSGGVIMPDISQEGVSQGIIKAVGPAAYSYGKEIEPQCKVGDTVAYPKRAAYSMDLDEEELLVCNEFDLFCIIKRGEK
jgi:co-chaperonin GroES (HSP10)